MSDGRVSRPWKTLSRRTVFGINRFLTVELHAVELPDGRVIDDWAWLAMPDYAVILARTAEGQFLCFRQRKYAVPGLFLAPPGGYLEPEETPLAAAQRELLEETGCSAATWHSLGSYVVDSNRGAGTAHLFLALDAVTVAPRSADDLEEQELLTLSREALEKAVTDGQIKVVAWAALIGLGLRKLDALVAAP